MDSTEGFNGYYQNGIHFHRLTFTSMFVLNPYFISGFTLLMFTCCMNKGDNEPPPPTLALSTAQVMCNTGIDTTPTDYDTTRWTELKAEDGYIIDIKYATNDNFVGEIIYPCGRMFLRPEVADALAIIKWELMFNGYKLKLFDGYRPRPAQQKLWDKVSNSNYVTRPSEGSMHNRGAAIDLTITDPDGKEFDMGTSYDFFGPEAHHNYTNLPREVLSRRQKLKSVMESHGFQSIRTEWWHYSYTKGSYPLDDWQWPCKN